MMNQNAQVMWRRLGVALLMLTVPAVAPLSARAAESGPVRNISRGWKVLRGVSGDTVPAANANWVDLETSRSRAYRLANFYEPGLPLWLEHTVNLSAADVTGYWVVSVPNRMMLDRAFINGQPLKDIASYQNTYEAMTPETRAIYAADPYKTQVYDMGISVRRRGEVTNQRWDVPALLLIDAKNLKVGDNRLVIQGHDYDYHGALLGQVQLRRPTLEDRIKPYAYHLANGTVLTNTVVSVQPKVPGPYTLRADVEVQDYLGATLRRDTMNVAVTGTSEAELELPQQSPNEYKALVTFSLGAEKLKPYWVYFQPRLQKSATRTSFSLEGGDWTVKSLETNLPTNFPLDNSGSRPTYVPGIQRGTWEWYQWKVRQMILRKTFTLPEGMSGRLLLSISDVRQTANVFINGQSMGNVHFTDIPKELDVTRAIKRQGENEIVVVLGDAETMAEALKLTTAKKTFINGAFRRPMLLGAVKIRAVPTVRVLRTWINTSVANKSLSAKVYVENSSTQAQTVAVNPSVLLKDQTVFAFPPQNVTVPAGQTSIVTFQRNWADPQLWSPFSPTLYGLKTTLRSGGNVQDEQVDRFGFKEITMKGDQILLNGKPFHALGHEYQSDGASSRFPMLDFHHEVELLRDVRALGYTYLRRGKIEPQIHDLQDEIGVMTSLHYGPWDNGQGDVGTDDETINLYTREPLNNIPSIVNHPSILMYNYGNEVYLGGNKTEKLAESLWAVVKKIKATDPTRPVNTQGSDDMNGRGDMIGAHYWNYSYLGIPLAQVPQELRERTTGFTKPNWDRHKVVNIDEFSWILPRAGYAWYGEGAMKQTPYRQPAYRPDRLHDVYPIVAKREREFQSYRRAQTAAFAAFSPGFISQQNIQPVMAAFFQENTRFWSGQPVTRVIDVFNDSGHDAEIEVELRLTRDGKTTVAWSQKIKMPQGDVKTVTATIPALTTNALTDVRAELVSRIGGVEQSRRTQTWSIFPKSWVGNLQNVSVGVFDPRGSIKGLLEAVNVKPIVVTPATLATQKIDVLVVGENIETADVAVAPDAIGRWVSAGGQALVLRQKKLGDWLPLPLEPRTDSYAFETFLYAVGHPLVSGLLPEDFWRWGGAELVNGMSYEPPRAGSVRVLAGKLPTEATLMEAFYGKGRFIISALELTPNKVAQEPVAARLLANILRAGKAVPATPAARTVAVTTLASAQVSPQLAAALKAASPAVATEQRTLVLSGTNGDRTQALKDKLRLEADFATTPPASLAPYKLLVMTDNEGNATPAEIGLKFQYFTTGRDKPLRIKNIRIAAPDGTNLVNGDTAKMEAFNSQVKGMEATADKQGNPPFPWSFNLWDGKSLGQWSVEKDPVSNENALTIRNLEEQGAAQMYMWQPAKLASGSTYEVSFDYLSAGGGKFTYEGKGLESGAFDIADTGNKWQRFTTKITRPGAPLPPDTFATPLRSWVENGGTLVVQGVTPALQTWLEKALGVGFKRNRMEAVRAYKVAYDPLLQGISDGDLAWRGHSGEWAFINRGPSEHDIIREEVVPEGGKVLTYPAVLVKKPIGQGELIIDQSRWAEVTNKGGEEWGLDSKLIAARLQTGLLLNVGAYFQTPEIKKNNVIGLSFQSVDLSRFLNRSREDETAGDGQGWIDLGPRFDLDVLESGTVKAGGVPFTIAEESKTGGNGLIMLRSSEQFKTLPQETGIIPVGKKAKSLFFLQTSAYANSPKGTTAWEYEIRYEGHSKLIMGQDFAPFTVKVPVKAEENVADWLGRPLVPAVWTHKTPAESDMNLYLQRWDNPRPDTPIESIVVRSLLQKEVPMVLGITVANDAPSLVNGDFAKAAPFSLRMKNFDVLEKKGDLPAGWSANAWHNTTVAQIELTKEPTTGQTAVALHNIEGRASMQLYTNTDVPLQVGKSYTVAFKYLISGDAEANFAMNIKGGKVDSDIPVSTTITLPKTGNDWKQFSGTVTAKEAATLGLNFQNWSSGADKVYYVRDVQVTEN